MNRVLKYKYDDLVFEELLGKGGFGEVYKGTALGMTFALKVIDTFKLLTLDKEIHLITRDTFKEILVMS